MNYGAPSGLAFTGAGITVAGVTFGQAYLVGIAVGLILAGALLVKFGFRRNKSMLDV